MQHRNNTDSYYLKESIYQDEVILSLKKMADVINLGNGQFNTTIKQVNNFKAIHY